MKSKTGLTPLEKMCMDNIIEATEIYMELEKQHPNELSDFLNSVHILQQLLAIRIVRRDYPKGWVNSAVKK